MAPVVEALRDRSDRVETAIALTGQHTDMVDQVLDAFGMTPDFDLGIMKEGQSLYDVGHGCLDGLRDAVRSFDPGMVLVQGDTATVFFGSLVGFFERTLVGHVEAGLRSHDRQAPYPEELFRRMTDALSDVHFVPTPLARRNLLAESTPQESIHVTGNTVVDALLGMVQGRYTRRGRGPARRARRGPASRAAHGAPSGVVRGAPARGVPRRPGSRRAGPGHRRRLPSASQPRGPASGPRALVRPLPHPFDGFRCPTLIC